ncbi:MAG: hypothetical protein AB1589_00570 [Cyanobacteriota bacterium]
MEEKSASLPPVSPETIQNVMSTAPKYGLEIIPPPSPPAKTFCHHRSPILQLYLYSLKHSEEFPMGVTKAFGFSVLVMIVVLPDRDFLI